MKKLMFKHIIAILLTGAALSVSACNDEKPKPEDPEITDPTDCENPDDPACSTDPCVKDPDSTECKQQNDPCAKDPDSTACKQQNDPCVKNPNDPSCQTDPDFVDPDKEVIPDADGDTISDKNECQQGDPETGEGCEDTDGDTIPDYKDEDSDNDTIPDKIEAFNGGDPKRAPGKCGINPIPAFRSTDADLNEISDSLEAGPDPKNPVDTDNDTIPDFCSPDNDGDGYEDAVEFTGFFDANGKSMMECAPDATEPGTAEKPFDCDGDTVPDYLDFDSDGDTIEDAFESSDDTDSDGFINRYDLDSDGDTIPDKDERGTGDKPRDSDNDEIPDYLDLDSDNDGLPDNAEVFCDNLGIHSSTLADTDKDGQSDLAEYAIATDNKADPKDFICNADKNVKDFIQFYFELPLSGEESTDTLFFTPQITKADVFLNIDNTGSMQDAIKNLQDHFTKVVVSAVRERVPDSQFGLSIFGDKEGTIWRLEQAITDNTDLFQQKLNAVSRDAYGTDNPEAGYHALYKITSDPSVGFREGSLPIIIHVTDAPSNNNGDVNAQKAFEQVNKIGARVVPLAIPFTAADNKGDWPALLKADAELIASSTNAKVPVCAYQISASQWVCGENKCCTNGYCPKSNKPNCGTYTSGVSAIENSCTLAISYENKDYISRTIDDINSLAYKTVLAIEALVKYGSYTVSTRVIGTEIPEDERASAEKTDTSCFLSKIEALEFVAPENTTVSDCLKNIPTAPADVAGVGYNDSFTNFAVGAAKKEDPKSKLTFKVTAKNDNCVKPATKARTYKAFIEVYNPSTKLIFDRQEVAIIVPGIPEEKIN
ncbi:MAG: VWA domain-containing protein [Proteobacteria bacterium]|nr:VWA domain-containing protein [Pseudomonadota bacterium]